MVTFTIGNVVLIPFPFSDLSRAKRRPAVVIAEVAHGDRILCQVCLILIHKPLRFLMRVFSKARFKGKIAVIASVGCVRQAKLGISCQVKVYVGLLKR